MIKNCSIKKAGKTRMMSQINVQISLVSQKKQEMHHTNEMGGN
jgi:hypothetical protein